eukprot:EG_transcript_20104
MKRPVWSFWVESGAQKDGIILLGDGVGSREFWNLFDFVQLQALPNNALVQICLQGHDPSQRELTNPGGGHFMLACALLDVAEHAWKLVSQSLVDEMFPQPKNVVGLALLKNGLSSFVIKVWILEAHNLSHVHSMMGFLNESLGGSLAVTFSPHARILQALQNVSSTPSTLQRGSGPTQPKWPILHGPIPGIEATAVSSSSGPTPPLPLSFWPESWAQAFAPPSSTWPLLDAMPMASRRLLFDQLAQLLRQQCQVLQSTVDARLSLLRLPATPPAPLQASPGTPGPGHPQRPLEQSAPPPALSPFPVIQPINTTPPAPL